MIQQLHFRQHAYHCSGISLMSLRSSHWHPCNAVMQEDAKIIQLVGQLGAKRWSMIAKELPGRIGKQCRERCPFFCSVLMDLPEM